MVDAWPAELPQCFNVPYSEGLGDSLVQYPTDTGPAISRARSAAVPYPLSGQMRMTRAQYLALKTFVRTTLIVGALPFSFPDPTDSGQTLLVRFDKGKFPTAQQIRPGVYSVGIQLTVMP